MKRRLYRPLLASIVFVLLVTSLAAPLDVPPLKGRVNDYAGVMSQEQIRSLETRLAQFEQETGHQVAVLAVPTLEGEDIEGFGIRVAESWKIGKKGFDNGVILLVAIKDRRLRLEVGYGLEGVLPDAIAKTIISNYIVPRFRAQDYAGGIVAGVGGAYFTLGSTGSFVQDMTAGRGFIGLAAMIFGAWTPIGAFLASLVFGFADALQARLSILNIALPSEFLLMGPYLVTIVVVAGLVGRVRAPAADGRPYDKE